MITLILCLKNKRSLEEKTIAYAGDRSKDTVKRSMYMVVLGHLQIPGEEIIFQRATCKFRNSWSSLNISLIHVKGIYIHKYIYQNVLSAYASWKYTGHDCGWRLSEILSYVPWTRNFSQKWGPIGLGSGKRGPETLWHITVGKVFCLNDMKTRCFIWLGLNVRRRPPI